MQGKQLSPLTAADILSDLKQGKRYVEIKAEHNVSLFTIWKIAVENGIKRYKGRPKEKVKSFEISRLKAGSNEYGGAF